MFFLLGNETLGPTFSVSVNIYFAISKTCSNNKILQNNVLKQSDCEQTGMRSWKKNSCSANYLIYEFIKKSPTKSSKQQVFTTEHFVMNEIFSSFAMIVFHLLNHWWFEGWRGVLTFLDARATHFIGNTG